MFKRTVEEIEAMTNKLGYKLIDTYIPNKKYHGRKVVVIDRIGYKYDVYFSHLQDTSRNISFVDVTNPYSLENIKLWVSLWQSDFELISDNVYKGARYKLHLYHKTCSTDVYLTWDKLYSGRTCPACSSSPKIVSNNNRLSIFFPDLVKEWHPTKNKDLTPNDVSIGTHRKVWWLCPNEHEYFSAIVNRVNGRGCKKCSDLQKESVIATELKKWCFENFEDVKEEYKILKNETSGKWLAYDIYIPFGKDLNVNGIYLEVHGGQHYFYSSKFYKTEKDFENRKFLDRKKKKFAKQNGFYIEVDLRKIKTTEQAIEFLEKELIKIF